MRGKSLCSLCQIILGRVSNVTTSIFVEKCQVSLQKYDMRSIAAHVPCMQLLPKTATWMISRATHVSNNSFDKGEKFAFCYFDLFVWIFLALRNLKLVLQMCEKNLHKIAKDNSCFWGSLPSRLFKKSHGKTQNIEDFAGHRSVGCGGIIAAYWIHCDGWRWIYSVCHASSSKLGPSFLRINPMEILGKPRPTQFFATTATTCEFKPSASNIKVNRDRHVAIPISNTLADESCT